MSAREAESQLEILQIYRLLQFVQAEDKAQIEKMVKLGQKNLINLTEPKNGAGVLQVAVLASNQDLVSFLLSQGAEPNVQDKKGRTPIMLAAEMGNYAMTSLLAHSNADLKLQDIEGKGVLFYCINPTLPHLRCLQMAIKFHADVNNVSTEGAHIFQLICEKAEEDAHKCFIMLDAGADPNATNQSTGVTALMAAAKVGALPLVRAILKKGADPNAMDHKRLTAVHYAAIGGFFEVIHSLSAFSADMGILDIDCCTPLHYAAATGNVNCCRFLAQRGCKSKLKNRNGLVPRLIAKEAGHKAATKELKKAEGQQDKIRAPIEEGLTSALWALTLHDWSNVFEAELREAIGSDADAEVYINVFISVLQELKAPVELEQLKAVTAVHDLENHTYLTFNEFLKGAKYIQKPYLLSTYLPKEKKGGKKGKGGKKKGKFALQMPICTLTPDLMRRRPDGGPPQFMIETYYDRSDSNRFDRTHPPDHPIMNDSAWYIEKPEKVFVNINYCVKSGDLESLDYAFSHGVPVDVQDQFYKTPLMVACSTGNYEGALYLLSQGADVNMCDQFSWTPLHHAAHAGQPEIIKLLLDAGATIDALTMNNGTPLMRAIQSSRLACVDLLIKAGASLHAVNKKEQSCLDIANAFADPRIIELVRNKVEPNHTETANGKGIAAKRAVRTQSSSATAGKTSQKDSNSIILQNTRITAGKTNAVDITFVPKTVWGKPPTTSQLLSKIERRKEVLSLEVDFDDFMIPFNQNIQRKSLELDHSNHRLDRK